MKRTVRASYSVNFPKELPPMKPAVRIAEEVSRSLSWQWAYWVLRGRRRTVWKPGIQFCTNQGNRQSKTPRPPAPFNGLQPLVADRCDPQGGRGWSFRTQPGFSGLLPAPAKFSWAVWLVFVWFCLKESLLSNVSLCHWLHLTDISAPWESNFTDIRLRCW